VATLNTRIDARFDAMMDQGALDEVRSLLPQWDATKPAARAIGAPDLIAHLRGQMSLDAAITAAKLATRQYAKRQRTWLRRRMADWRELA
jgi:tRNA dimethylallyltransferase